MKERSNQTLGMVGIDENLFLNKIQKYPKACIINRSEGRRVGKEC